MGGGFLVQGYKQLRALYFQWVKTRAKAYPKPRLAADSSGQAIMELALILVLVFGFFLFFVQLALILSFGNYVHYATFMAARAYLAGGPTPADQEQRARDVMLNTVRIAITNEDRFPMIARGEGAGEPAGVQIGPSQVFDGETRALSWMQGVRYTFRSRLFLLPLAVGQPTPDVRGPGGLVLTSEAWLGREPTFSECMQSMQGKGIIDNGC